MRSKKVVWRLRSGGVHKKMVEPNKNISFMADTCVVKLDSGKVSGQEETTCAGGGEADVPPHQII